MKGENTKLKPVNCDWFACRDMWTLKSLTRYSWFSTNFFVKIVSTADKFHREAGGPSKWTFLKGLKRLKGWLFKRIVASGWQNRVLYKPFSIFFNAFMLTTVIVNVSRQQQGRLEKQLISWPFFGRLASYTSPYGKMYTIFPWPI